MKRIAQSVQFLPDMNRHEKKLGIVHVMIGLEDAGHGQLFRQHDFAQFVDRLALLAALRFLQLLHAVEDFAEITGRINGQLVPDVDVKFAGQLHPEHGRVAIQIERSFNNEVF